MRASYGVFVLVLALALSAPVSAADFQAGWEAYKRGDYAMALEEWLPLAEQGDTKAQYNLAIIYAKGQGVPQDYTEAAKWVRLAAEQGDANAQYNLGVMYAEGQGVIQDYTEAAKWYRLAAERGDANAQQNLGVMYAEGKGVIQDHVQAHLWFNLAAARQPPGEDRDRAVDNRNLAEKHMTPDQVAEAQRLAREWEPMKLLFKKEDIADLQNGLAALGYNPGFAYGIVGPQTKEAIRAFQRDQGLPVDGEASKQLWYDILREGLLPKSEEKKAN